MPTFSAWYQRKGSPRAAWQAAFAAYKSAPGSTPEEKAFHALQQAGAFDKGVSWAEVQQEGLANLDRPIQEALKTVIRVAGIEQPRPSWRNTLKIAANPSLLGEEEGAILNRMETRKLRPPPRGKPVPQGMEDISRTAQMLTPILEPLRVGMQALPRAVRLQQLEEAQTGPPGELAHELGVIRQLFAPTDRAAFNQLVAKGASYRDILLQFGWNPKAAAWLGFVLDTGILDPTTTALGKLTHVFRLLGAERKALQTLEAAKSLPERAKAVEDVIAASPALEAGATKAAEVKPLPVAAENPYVQKWTARKMRNLAKTPPVLSPSPGMLEKPPEVFAPPPLPAPSLTPVVQEQALAKGLQKPLPVPLTGKLAPGPIEEQMQAWEEILRLRNFPPARIPTALKTIRLQIARGTKEGQLLAQQADEHLASQRFAAYGPQAEAEQARALARETPPEAVAPVPVPENTPVITSPTGSKALQATGVSPEEKQLRLALGKIEDQLKANPKDPALLQQQASQIQKIKAFKAAQSEAIPAPEAPALPDLTQEGGFVQLPVKQVQGMAEGVQKGLDSAFTQLKVSRGELPADLAQVSRLKGTLVYKILNLPIGAFREAKLNLSPLHWLRDIAGSSMLYMQLFGVAPEQAATDILDALTAKLGKTADYETVRKLMDSSGNLAVGRWLEGQVNQAGSKFGTLGVGGGKVSTFINEVFQEAAMRNRLRELSAFGEGADKQFAERVLKGQGNPVQAALPTRLQETPIRWNNFSEAARGELTKMEYIGGNPHALPQVMRDLSAMGILPPFLTFNLQTPWYLTKQALTELRKGNAMPLIHQVRNFQNLRQTTRPPVLDEKGNVLPQDQTKQLAPLPSGLRQYQQFFPNQLTPFEFAPVYDKSGAMTGTMGMGSVTTGGLGESLTGPLDVLTAPISGLYQLIGDTPLVDTLKRVMETSSKPSDVVGRAQAGGGVWPDQAQALREGMAAAGIPPGQAPSGMAGDILQNLARIYAPSEPVSALSVQNARLGVTGQPTKRLEDLLYGLLGPSFSSKTSVDVQKPEWADLRQYFQMQLRKQMEDKIKQGLQP